MSTAQTRLNLLRAEMKRRKLDGFIVPRADRHQGEYVAPSDERLAWLTGFTGSAGLAVVLTSEAALFTDGRYTLQAGKEIDKKLYSLRHSVDEPASRWLEEKAVKSMRLGIDPWLHSEDGVNILRRALEKSGAELVLCKDNPLDAVWRERPPPPLAPILPHPLIHAGVSSRQKRKEIAKQLAKDGADALVISSPESLAWLFNVRGGDVPYAPLPHGFAILLADGKAKLFLHPEKLTKATRAHLGREVAIHGEEDFIPALVALGKEKKSLEVDFASCPALVVACLRKSGAKIVNKPDPTLLVRACKNEAEIKGMRAAHRRDGQALTRFISWLAKEAPKGGVTEISAAEKLEEFRRAAPEFVEPSFATISAVGPHGAIVHYRADEKSDAPLTSGSLYLLDSGGQYPDGTTDVTRTIFIGPGKPTAEMRRLFTLVLKGHIALSRAVFPVGTTGTQLDILARQFLWQAGLDYDHGTGHGVGAFLSVHEGPQRISKISSNVALRPGMVLSNEPGYYAPGRFGIRIENLMLVVSLGIPKGGEREMLGFEPLTLVPLDSRLIEKKLLTAEEEEWLKALSDQISSPAP
jgi:Xaa-Pro aminopeptidase